MQHLFPAPDTPIIEEAKKLRSIGTANARMVVTWKASDLLS